MLSKEILINFSLLDPKKHEKLETSLKFLIQQIYDANQSGELSSMLQQLKQSDFDKLNILMELNNITVRKLSFFLLTSIVGMNAEVLDIYCQKIGMPNVNGVIILNPTQRVKKMLGNNYIKILQSFYQLNSEYDEINLFQVDLLKNADASKEKIEVKKLSKIAESFLKNIELIPDPATYLCAINYCPHSASKSLQGDYSGYTNENFNQNQKKSSHASEISTKPESKTIFEHTNINIGNLMNGSKLITNEHQKKDKIPYQVLNVQNSSNKTTFESFDFRGSHEASQKNNGKSPAPKNDALKNLLKLSPTYLPAQNYQNNQKIRTDLTLNSSQIPQPLISNRDSPQTCNVKISDSTNNNILISKSLNTSEILKNLNRTLNTSKLASQKKDGYQLNNGALPGNSVTSTTIYNSFNGHKDVIIQNGKQQTTGKKEILVRDYSPNLNLPITALSSPIHKIPPEIEISQKNKTYQHRSPHDLLGNFLKPISKLNGPPKDNSKNIIKEKLDLKLVSNQLNNSNGQKNTPNSSLVKETTLNSAKDSTTSKLKGSDHDLQNPKSYFYKNNIDNAAIKKPNSSIQEKMLKEYQKNLISNKINSILVEKKPLDLNGINKNSTIQNTLLPTPKEPMNLINNSKNVGNSTNLKQKIVIQNPTKKHKPDERLKGLSANYYKHQIINQILFI